VAERIAAAKTVPTTRRRGSRPSGRAGAEGASAEALDAEPAPAPALVPLAGSKPAFGGVEGGTGAAAISRQEGGGASADGVEVGQGEVEDVVSERGSWNMSLSPARAGW
jgi:hypothetical protein